MLTPAYPELMRESIEGEVFRIEHLLSVEDPNAEHRQSLLKPWRQLEVVLMRVLQSRFGNRLSWGEPNSLYQLPVEPAASLCTFFLRDAVKRRSDFR